MGNRLLSDSYKQKSFPSTLKSEFRTKTGKKLNYGRLKLKLFMRTYMTVRQEDTRVEQKKILFLV